MSKPILGCPIDYYEDNLFFNSNSSLFGKNCWAAYKLGGFNYDFQNRDTKDAILLSLVHTIKNVSHVKIMVVPTTEDVNLHYGNFKKNLRPNDVLYDNAVTCADATREYLKQSEQNWIDYTTYLIVKLQDEAVDQVELIGKQVREFFKEPIYSAMSLALLSPADITTVTLQKYRKIEGELFQTLNSCVELHRLRPKEMQRLLKRVFYKGLRVPFKLNKTVIDVKDENTGAIRREYSEDWQPYRECGKKEIGKKLCIEYYRPYKPDIIHLFSGRLKCEGNKGISITHDSGVKSYQSYLTVINIPEAIIFPGREWIYRLQKQRVPVEICIDIQNTHYKKALDDLANLRKELNSQMQECLDSGDVPPSKIREAHEQIESLCRELGDNRLPMSETTISLCVAGSDPEQVEKDIGEIVEHLDKSEFEVARSGADQMQLFMQHIPGTETFTRDFVKRLSPFPIAGGIFGVNNRVGDNVGYYIGMANDKPVFFSPTQACLERKSPAGTAYGNLGYGKTYAMRIITFQHVLNGGRAIIIDPKGEYEHWKDLPILGKHTNVVVLTSDPKNKGLLDPFIMFPNDLNHASDLARTCIMKLSNIKSGTKEDTILKESVKKVVSMTNPCMLKVVDGIKWIMENDEDGEFKSLAKSLHRNLKATMDNGLSQLLFGDGTEQAINISGRMNVISLHNMSFAGAEKHEDSYNDDEKLSSILLYLAVDFVRQFMNLYPNEPKLVFVDESWKLTALQIGRELTEALIRLGRSLYLAVLLNGHSVNDLPSDEMRGLVTYKFCFHTGDDEEAKRMLDYLKLDITKENMNILMGKEKDGGLGNGECLFSDLYGRVSRLKFDVVFSNLDEFFSTTPDPEKQQIETDAEKETPVQKTAEEQQAPEQPDEPKEAEKVPPVPEIIAQEKEVAQQPAEPEQPEQREEPEETGQDGEDDLGERIDSIILQFDKIKNKTA